MTRSSKTRRPLHGYESPRALIALLLAAALASCDVATVGVADPTTQFEADAAPAAHAWHAVFPSLSSLVLAGWAASADDAFFVGSEGYVLRYRSSRWYQYEVPSQASLWWIWGTDASNVYAGGEEGTLLHFDGARWSSIDAGLDPSQTIWGIWGSSATEIWLVGGKVRSDGPGFVLRGDGERFEPRVLRQPIPNLFKIWGPSQHEIYAVGDHGLVLDLSRGEVDVQYLDPDGSGDPVQSLFTVAGNGSGDLLAVGGVSSGLLFEKQGAAWKFIDLQSLGLNGVAVAASGEAYAVGLEGTIRHRVAGAWRDEDYGSDQHYHSAVLMGDVAFAVGGDLLSARADRRGLIASNGNVTGGEITWIPLVGAQQSDGGAVDGSAPLPSPPAQSDAGYERPVDAGLVDAGAKDAAAVDAGAGDAGTSGPLPGPSEPCTTQLECSAPTECWLIQAENENRCVTACATAAECPPEYGPNPQCAVPGCQTLYTVCMPAEWKGCF